MKTGDIVLIKVNTFRTWYRKLLAKAIQLIDATYYHHCVLYVEGEFHDADSKGIEISGPSKYKGDEYLVLRPIADFDEEEVRRVITISNEHLGKPYDYLGTLVFQLLYKLTGIWFGPTHKSSQRKLYCSEHCVQHLNRVRGWFPRYWTISPGDILRQHSGYLRVVEQGTF